MKKFPVNSSNLCLRFYKHNGWTLKILNEYVISGEIVKHPRWNQDEEIFRYFVPKIGTQMDIERFLNERVSIVHRAYDDHPEESDASFIKRML